MVSDKTVNLPAGQLVTEISDYQDETTLSYRTIFAPDSNAYDTYVMPYIEKKIACI